MVILVKIDKSKQTNTWIKLWVTFYNLAWDGYVPDISRDNESLLCLWELDSKTHDNLDYDMVKD